MSETSTVYVVFGRTGEYSDRTEWLVRAFASEAKAQALVVEYARIAKEVELRTQLDKSHPDYFDEYRKYKEGFQWPHPDPGFNMDYTGTSYYYEKVELEQ